MVEVSLAVTVLVVAVMAMSASTYRMHTLRRQNRERALAQNAVRTMVEEIQARSHEGAQRSPATWGPELCAALAPGGDLGPTFAVRELDPPPDEPTVGTIRVVTDETLTDAALGLELGLPRDLNGDGLTDSSDVLATAVDQPPRVLPVVVTARWRGVDGVRQIVHPFYVIGY